MTPTFRQSAIRLPYTVQDVIDLYALRSNVIHSGHSAVSLSLSIVLRLQEIYSSRMDSLLSDFDVKWNKKINLLIHNVLVGYKHQ